mmetsp:Transcript_12743/g.37498  ORF Transcript_12743/g.37498 Transcript_12743/m.37498 type:complete len:113 (-) Transcript_12743:1046-1384(-)
MKFAGCRSQNVLDNRRTVGQVGTLIEKCNAFRDKCHLRLQNEEGVASAVDLNSETLKLFLEAFGPGGSGSGHVSKSLPEPFDAAYDTIIAAIMSNPKLSAILNSSGDYTLSS